MPTSDNGTFFRVTVDNVLWFDFPSLAMAEAFAADYGPGCEISREILPEAAGGDPVASGEAEPADLPTEPLPVVSAVTWHCLEHRGETIYASQNIRATTRQQRLAGIGTLTTVKLPTGAQPAVDARWPEQLERLAIKRGFLAPPEPEPQIEPEPAPVFRFDPRWLLDEDCPHLADDGFPDDGFPDDREADDPTPEEIEAECAAIRREWDAGTLRSRAGQIAMRDICRGRLVKGGRR